MTRYTRTSCVKCRRAFKSRPLGSMIQDPKICCCDNGFDVITRPDGTKAELHAPPCYCVKCCPHHGEPSHRLPAVSS